MPRRWSRRRPVRGPYLATSTSCAVPSRPTWSWPRWLRINTWEVAKECLTTNDQTFATRPTAVASKVLAYNYAMIGLTPMSRTGGRFPRFRLSSCSQVTRIELLRHIRESEVLASVRGVYEQYKGKVDVGTGALRAVLVDMKRWFGDITVKMVFRMIVGRWFKDNSEGDEKGRQALREFFDLMGRFIVSHGLPYLRWLDLGSHEKAMKRMAEELDQVVQGWLDGHKARRKLNEEAGGAKSTEQDFMDVMLSILEGNNEIRSYDVRWCTHAFLEDLRS
ncbi:hypothetical protein CRG98_034137 [Punica granatum]|uniref:Cytochrome P450 CYP82H23-like n=1 Tax=Punica granatum TaxID=22663 RepID=A0A2I0IN93_PUNGR|nr:hypothetical protein CRG98_034137 [Punica granatum]